jgi:DNA-binding MarR family transcriptional regulator
MATTRLKESGAPEAAASVARRLAAVPVAPLAQKYLAVLVMTLAGRLNRGASNFYMGRFGITMVDYRIVLALGLAKGLNVGEVATAADVDKAAASRSLRLLEQRGLVDLEQTSGRGRAAIVHLTEAGRAFERELKKAARVREQRFVASLTADERDQAAALVRKLIDGVPNMNKE